VMYVPGAFNLLPQGILFGNPDVDLRLIKGLVAVALCIKKLFPFDMVYKSTSEPVVGKISANSNSTSLEL